MDRAELLIFSHDRRAIKEAAQTDEGYGARLKAVLAQRQRGDGTNERVKGNGEASVAEQFRQEHEQMLADVAATARAWLTEEGRAVAARRVAQVAQVEEVAEQHPLRDLIVASPNAEVKEVTSTPLDNYELTDERFVAGTGEEARVVDEEGNEVLYVTDGVVRRRVEDIVRGTHEQREYDIGGEPATYDGVYGTEGRRIRLNYKAGDNGMVVDHEQGISVGAGGVLFYSTSEVEGRSFEKLQPKDGSPLQSDEIVRHGDTLHLAVSRRGGGPVKYRLENGQQVQVSGGAFHDRRHVDGNDPDSIICDDRTYGWLGAIVWRLAHAPTHVPERMIAQDQGEDIIDIG